MDVGQLIRQEDPHKDVRQEPGPCSRMQPRPSHLPRVYVLGVEGLWAVPLATSHIKLIAWWTSASRLTNAIQAPVMVGGIGVGGIAACGHDDTVSKTVHHGQLG